MIVTCTECGSDNGVDGTSSARCQRCDAPLSRARLPKRPIERNASAEVDSTPKKSSLRYWIIGSIIALKLTFILVKVLGLDNPRNPPPRPPANLLPERIIKSFELFEPVEIVAEKDGLRRFQVSFNRLKNILRHERPILRIELGDRTKTIVPQPFQIVGGIGQGKIDFVFRNGEIPAGITDLTIWLEYTPAPNLPPRTGRMESNEVHLKLEEPNVQNPI